MGIFKNYVSQTRKPEGVLGKMMLNGMKCYTPKQIISALKTAGFSDVKTFHHKNKPWITVVAVK